MVSDVAKWDEVHASAECHRNCKNCDQIHLKNAWLKVHYNDFLNTVTKSDDSKWCKKQNINEYRYDYPFKILLELWFISCVSKKTWHKWNSFINTTSLCWHYKQLWHQWLKISAKILLRNQTLVFHCWSIILVFQSTLRFQFFNFHIFVNFILRKIKQVDNDFNICVKHDYYS